MKLVIFLHAALPALTSATARPPTRPGFPHLLLALLLALLPQAAAQRTAPGPTTVRVVRADDGHAIAGATVRLGARHQTTDTRGRAVFTGVPEGAHRIEVDLPGFDLVDRDEVLPAGARDDVVVDLRASLRAELLGRVVHAVTGLPVPGARVDLVPLQTAQRRSTALRVSSGADGTFHLLDIPAGRYLAEVTVAGAATLRGEIELPGGREERTWSIEPLGGRAPTTVRVLDAVTGAPIAGANVRIGDAPPAHAGPVADTDADGVATFADARIGRLNWLGPDGALTFLRRRSVAVASAPGYAPTTLPTLLLGGPTLDLRLAPDTPLEEREPNNSITAAQRLLSGQPVTGQIGEPGDRDHFLVQTFHATRTRVRLTAGDQSLQLHMTLPTGEGVHAFAVGGHQTQEHTLYLAAGTYALEVQQYYNNAASRQPYTLTVHAVPAADALEPNDTADDALEIASGEEVSGVITPAGDDDHFALRVERHGMLRVQVTAPGIPLTLTLANAEGVPVHAMSVSDRATSSFVREVATGRHTLRVVHYYDNTPHPDPYRLRMDFLGDEGFDDTPPDDPRPARTISENGLGAAVIAQSGRDATWSVAVPGPGRLEAFQVNPALSTILELHPLDGRGPTAQSAGPRSTSRLWVDYDKPTRSALLAREYYDNTPSINSAVLVGTVFVPADENDSLIRNDSPSAATEINLGESDRATILPAGDNDWYRIHVDHPGWLDFEFTPGDQPLHVDVCRSDDPGQPLGSVAASPGDTQRVSVAVLPGAYLARVRHYYNNTGSAIPYDFRATLWRAQPQERAPLAGDPPRTLEENVAIPLLIEHAGDHDTFLFTAPRGGPWRIESAHGNLPITLEVFDDASGDLLGQTSFSTAGTLHVPTDGPRRLRIVARHYYDNTPSRAPGFLRITQASTPLTGELVVAEPAPLDPTRILLRRVPGPPGTARAESVEVELAGARVNVPAEGTATLRAPSEGLHTLRARLLNGGTLAGIWTEIVDARGVQPRTGVRIVALTPAEGETIARPQPVRLHAVSYTGAPVREVALTIDGEHGTTLRTAPFETDIPWNELAAGTHTLGITATDARGVTGTLTRTVSLDPYFDLQPGDGSTLTGPRVRVAWIGAEDSAARVRWRTVGTDVWNETAGRTGPGRRRTVDLDGVEAGMPVEFQPLGAHAAGPVRRVTRLPGLAFERREFHASIERDYDQTASVAVRNLASESRTVRLTCEAPPAASGLLVGFVGAGSDELPFTLAPGELCHFRLALSAQDVTTPVVRFAVRLEGQDGATDVADVRVDVRLPKVDLAWERIGEDRLGGTQTWRLHNRGDTLTDLGVSTTEGTDVSPSLQHALFPAGATADFTLAAELTPGFESVEATLSAHAVGTTVERVTRIELPDGHRVYSIPLLAGERLPGAEPTPEDNIQLARTMVGAFLNPAYVDWSRRTDPQDTDGDGRPDRWSWFDRDNAITWTGDSGDGSGDIDFVHADVGSDGRHDYAAFRTERGWQRTNLVDAHLEANFQLHGPHEAYQPHDLDIVLNGRVVGRVHDALPEGNMTFPVPPSALLHRGGEARDVDIEIHSRHVRGGHYASTSDFRLKTRLTGSERHVIARSEEEARRAVFDHEGITLGGADYSVSASDLAVEPRPRVGEVSMIRARIRNVGAGFPEPVDVALVRVAADGTRREIARATGVEVPLSGFGEANLPWLATAGIIPVHVVVDPDAVTDDAARDNNEAVLPCIIPGEDPPPTVAFASPGEGMAVPPGVVAVAVRAADDAGIEAVELRVDNSLPVHLARGPDGLWTGHALLQTGACTLQASARDVAGQVATAARAVIATGTSPAPSFTSPQTGTSVPLAPIAVEIAVAGDAEIVVVRGDEGPWIPAERRGERWILEYTPEAPGPLVLEAIAATARGARGEARLELEVGDSPADTPVDVATPPEGDESDRDRQPGRPPRAPGDRDGARPPPPDGQAPQRTPDTPPAVPPGTAPEPPPPPAWPPGVVDIPGVGPVDVAGPPNQPVPPVLDDAGGDAPGRPRRDREPPFRDVVLPVDDVFFPPFEGLYDPIVDLPPGWLEPEDAEAGPQPVAATPEPTAEPGAPPAPPRAAAPPPPRPRPGAFVGMQGRQADWYCTNRPDVRLRLRLPPGLLARDKPRPGTPQFDAMVQRLLQDMRRKGIDTSALERMHQAMRNHVNRLDQPGELPGWLEAWGFGSPPDPRDAAALAAWRAGLRDRLDAFYLNCLSTQDPALIAGLLRQRAEAFGQFDKAMQEHAQAAVQMIDSYQRESEMWAQALVGMIPGTQAGAVATAVWGLYDAWNGEAALSGAQLSTLERVFGAVFAVAPFAVSQWAKTAGGQQFMKAADEMISAWGEAGSAYLARALNIARGNIDDATRAMQQARAAEMQAARQQLRATLREAVAAIDNTPAGRAARASLQADTAASRQLINRIAASGPGQPGWDDLVRQFQANKTAQALVGAADVPDTVRQNLVGTLRAWYDGADASVCTRLGDLLRASADELPDFARQLGIADDSLEALQQMQQRMRDAANRAGIPLNDVQVDVLTITNRRPPTPGQRVVTSVGRDRDVTYVLRDRSGRIIGDVDHNLSRGFYEQEFYRSAHGRLPRTPEGAVDFDAIRQAAREMDQTVTSRWHVEAYNTGSVALDDFLDKSITPTLTRIEDVRDTMIYKSAHWFEQADEALHGGNAVLHERCVTEGVRQATKQWDDLVLSRVRQYNLDPARAVPPNLQEAVDILRQVKDRVIPVEHGRRALAAIGTNFDEATRSMAHFLEAVEKGPGRVFRGARSAELVSRLGRVAAPGTPGWANQSLAMINDALRRGHIGPDQFQTLRTRVLSRRPADPAWTAQARQQRLIAATE